MTNRIGLLCFSPGKTSRKIGMAIASGLGTDTPVIFDITPYQARMELMADKDVIKSSVDHVVVGGPVHSGKLPLPFIQALKGLAGQGLRCTAFVAFGNRDYGIALYQLVEILLHNKFHVTGAGAFIARHSYSDIVPVAIDRPDQSDVDLAVQMGNASKKAGNRLKLDDVPVQLDTISQSKKYSAIRPVHYPNLCNNCGVCAKKCPLNVLSPDSGLYQNRASKKLCLGCMACVQNCPAGAKIAKTNPIVALIMKIILKKASQVPLQPTIIIGNQFI